MPQTSKALYLSPFSSFKEYLYWHIMDHLPLSDIPMTVSAINFLLRDEEFDNLDQICFFFNVEREEMDRMLSSEGYSYNDKYRRVI